MRYTTLSISSHHTNFVKDFPEVYMYLSQRYNFKYSTSKNMGVEQHVYSKEICLLNRILHRSIFDWLYLAQLSLTLSLDENMPI